MYILNIFCNSWHAYFYVHSEWLTSQSSAKMTPNQIIFSEFVTVINILKEEKCKIKSNLM